jgi:sulfate transport system substrate-binding protein
MSASSSSRPLDRCAHRRCCHDLLVTGCVGAAAPAGGPATTLHLVNSRAQGGQQRDRKKFAETPDGENWRGVVWRLGRPEPNHRRQPQGRRELLARRRRHPAGQGGLVDEGWKSSPTKGIVSDSTVAIVVQQGSPLGIKGWSDLIRPGVKIYHAEPGLLGIGPMEHPGRLPAGHRRRRAGLMRRPT